MRRQRDWLGKERAHEVVSDANLAQQQKAPNDAVSSKSLSSGSTGL
jgi:hypothetical protein